ERDAVEKARVIEEVLDNIGRHTDPPDMSDLAKELTEEEVLSALRALAKGKAPGVDGIPTELWTRLHEIFVASEKRRESNVPGENVVQFNVVRLLTAVYNDIERHGVMKGTKFA
ncbi:hypothetical protein C8R43DRAFT_824241, partial [Mycena crocata]